MTSLLPPNASPLQRALESASAPIRDIPILLRYLHDPDRCPAHLLPWLAWARQVDVWDPDWSVERQRAVIAAMPEIHRTRGTVGAVRRAMAAQGHPCLYLNWSEAGLPRGTFALQTAANLAFAASDLTTLLAVIASAKALRSHLWALITTDTQAGGALHVGITGCMVYRLITSPALFLTAPATPARPDLTVGVATVSRIVL